MKYAAIILAVFVGCKMLAWADKPLPPVKIQHSEMGFATAYWNGENTALFQAALGPATHAIKPARR